MKQSENKRYRFKNKNGVKKYRYLVELCRVHGLNYQKIRNELLKQDNLNYSDCKIEIFGK